MVAGRIWRFLNFIARHPDAASSIYSENVVCGVSEALLALLLPWMFKGSHFTLELKGEATELRKSPWKVKPSPTFFSIRTIPLHQALGLPRVHIACGFQI